MKKILICLLVFTMLFSFTGCGRRKTPGQRIAEKVFEETAGGDLDIDGDKVTITGDNGEIVTFGDNKWPTSELTNAIPEFKNGKVNSVLESPGYVVISLESVEKEDAISYFKTIKKSFPRDVFEINGEDMTSFSGKNDAGVNVTLVYAEDMLTINVIAPQQ